MYDFKMPSKLVKNGDPLPTMPAGVGAPMGSAASMQPSQMRDIESLMSNYNQNQMAPNAGGSSLTNGMIPQQIPSFGMPQMVAKNTNNGNAMNGGGQYRSTGPAFFTL